MAYIRKRGARWRAEVQKGGVRVSDTFATKAAAVAWATREEAAIEAGQAGKFPAKTLADALDRYERDVSAHKRGERWESARLGLFRREWPALCARVMHTITTADLAEWRDARLKQVSSASVLREVALLRNVWTVAGREWLWCADPSPWRALRMPSEPAARTRLMGWREIRRLCRWMHYRTGRPPSTGYEAAAWALLLSLRTGMRAGEVLQLDGKSVDLAARVATLETHKTVHLEGARRVPLTRQAVRLLGWLDGAALPITSGTLDTLFRRARDSLLIEDLHFHDARATALTHLARKVDVMTLARISGHRDLQLLLRVYYRETPAQIAARL